MCASCLGEPVKLLRLQGKGANLLLSSFMAGSSVQLPAAALYVASSSPRDSCDERLGPPGGAVGRWWINEEVGLAWWEVLTLLEQRP